MQNQITILKRATIKKASADYGVNPGDIVYLIKGSTGKVYMTTLRRTKKHSCLCAGFTHRKKCYHIDHLRGIENARWEAEHSYRMSDEVHAKLASIAHEAIIETPEIEEEVTELKDIASAPEIIGHEAIEEVPAPPCKGNLHSQPQTAEMPAWLAMLPSRREKVNPALVEDAKKEVLLEEEIARRLSILKADKIDSLRWIASKRGLTIKSRKKIDYINAIISSIRLELEREYGLAA